MQASFRVITPKSKQKRWKEMRLASRAAVVTPALPLPPALRHTLFSQDENGDNGGAKPSLYSVLTEYSSRRLLARRKSGSRGSCSLSPYTKKSGLLSCARLFAMASARANKIPWLLPGGFATGHTACGSRGC